MPEKSFKDRVDNIEKTIIDNTRNIDKLLFQVNYTNEILTEIKDTKKANKNILLGSVFTFIALILSVATCSYKAEVRYSILEKQNIKDKENQEQINRNLKDEILLISDQQYYLNQKLDRHTNFVDSLVNKQHIYYKQEYKDLKKRIITSRCGSDKDTIIRKINPNIPFGVYDSMNIQDY